MKFALCSVIVSLLTAAAPAVADGVSDGFEVLKKRGWRVQKHKRSDVGTRDLCFEKCKDLMDPQGTPLCTGIKWRRLSNKPCRVFRGGYSGSCGNLNPPLPANRDQCWDVKNPNPRRAYLKEKFPSLWPLASEATVATYTEKENTMTRSSGIVLEVWKGTADSTALSWFASTDGGRLDMSAVSKSEATLLCVTKCEEVLEGCTLFRLNEHATADGEVYECYFYGDDTATTQFPVVTPFLSFQDSDGNDVTTTAVGVFHKGEELALPVFHGCDVPLGEVALFPLINCRLLKFFISLGAPAYTLTPDCEDMIASASGDFEAHIWPGVKCTLEALYGDTDKLGECLACLAEWGAALGCESEQICGEDSFITEKCGDFCPPTEECVSKIETSFLCQVGAIPRWNVDGAVASYKGGCMNSDTPPHFTYLADSGNGDYKCLP